MQDKRFVQPNGEAIMRFRMDKGWTQDKLRQQAGVSLDTIKRAEAGERKQLGKMSRIATQLGVELTTIVRHFDPESAAVKTYTWDDLIAGAKKVGEGILKDGKLLIDAVLTFPGPSSLFCGLVLAMLPLEIFVRIPVYTGIFVDTRTSTSGRLRFFRAISMPRFKILIPRELAADKTKRILVIDDAIITGGTMKELRRFLSKDRDSKNLKFACCICYEGRTLPTEKPPEIIGLLNLEQRRTFPMPWGRDSFCFEDAFTNTTSATKRKQARSHWGRNGA